MLQPVSSNQTQDQNSTKIKQNKIGALKEAFYQAATTSTLDLFKAQSSAFEALPPAQITQLTVTHLSQVRSLFSQFSQPQHKPIQRSLESLFFAMFTISSQFLQSSGSQHDRCELILALEKQLTLCQLELNKHTCSNNESREDLFVGLHAFTQGLFSIQLLTYINK